MKQMTQEQKELLLKDLCARLPYEVKAYVKHWSKLDRKYYEDTYDVKSVFPSLNEIHVQSKTGSVNVLLGYSDYDIRPYLFPLSSMTEEQSDFLHKNPHGIYVQLLDNTLISASTKGFDWLNKNHFDYRNLIPMGSASDATKLNIY